jgi:hypothetical protein
LLETEAHSHEFLAKIRHITQVVLNVAVSSGLRTVTVRKAVSFRQPCLTPRSAAATLVGRKEDCPWEKEAARVWRRA